MSKFEEKVHPFDSGRVPGICSRCGMSAGDPIHAKPDSKEAEAHDRLMAEVQKLRAEERTRADNAILDPLAAVLEAVRREIVKQPCRCEVNTQGLNRCRRCLMLA